MKRITIPEPIKIANDQEPDAPPMEFGLLWFARHFLNQAEKFNRTGIGIRYAARIEDAIMEAIEAKAPHVDLHNEDCDILVGVIDEPGDIGMPSLLVNKETGKPVPMPPRVLVPFVTAFSGATDAPAEDQKEAAE